MSTTDEKLGRYGHHPDAATDFEVEVDELIAMDFDLQNKVAPHHDFMKRLSYALDFNVGAVESCVLAKQRLRALADNWR